MKKAKANPKTHVPSTFDAFKYFVMEIPVGEENRHKVRHSIIEFCTETDG